jgi:hypothetical protein
MYFVYGPGWLQHVECADESIDEALVLQPAKNFHLIFGFKCVRIPDEHSDRIFHPITKNNYKS